MRDELPGAGVEPQVSVIVPCYNSERTIRACLQSLLEQQTTIPYEVIVVDSSSDRTSEIVASDFPSVRLIRLEKRTFAGAARNAAIRSSDSPFCLMIDSDCIAAPDLVERAMRRHREDNYAAIGGSLANGTPRSISGWIGYLIEFKEYMPSTPLRLETSVPTANVLYRREVLEEQGLFDEDMWLAEDILLNWRIFRSGGRILFDPEIKVTHLNRTGWREVLTYQMHLGRLSSVARRRGQLPGTILLRFPPLIALMPFARLLRAVSWLARHDRKALLPFAALWPAYLVAASFWSYGFLVETLVNREASKGQTA